MSAMYNPLKHNDLIKRGNITRLENFIDMMNTGKLFLTTRGMVKLNKEQRTKAGEKVDTKKLFGLMQDNGFAMVLTGVTEKGSPVQLQYPKDFFKTPEFGGKGAGSGTAAEDRYLKLFKEEIQKTLQKEQKPYIDIKIAGRVVRCSDCISTPKGLSKRDPKADFIILDEKGNYVAFLSHKAGSKPSDFQQYGGLSDPAFAGDDDVKKFIKDVQKFYPSGLVSGVSLMRPVKSKDVIMMSIYGVEYGGKPGIQNVDEFHQGEMKLKKLGNTYEITSVHKGTNGDAVKASGYEPIYFARYTGDRGASIGGMFVGKARIGVFPLGKAVKTTITI